ncbi:MAG: ATP synthase F1 subunit delta [Bacteriovoracaceae bacterium]|jgi:F-type H+-transporting ATPase subunit delta|nr:ATP synthase F1 subunit delta [Bacteriovoracaceae bacterium]
MKEQIIAKAYAKSLIELGDKVSVDIATQLTEFNQIINESNNLENVLFLDLFTQDEKKAVLSDIFGKLSFDKMIQNFVFFLIEEKRVGIFPLIYKELIVIDDHRRGFLKGYIEGTDDSINEEAKMKLLTYLEKKIGKKLELEYQKSPRVTAGYRVTVEDLQLDASVDNQLESLKHSIIGE